MNLLDEPELQAPVTEPSDGKSNSRFKPGHPALTYLSQTPSRAAACVRQNATYEPSWWMSVHWGEADSLLRCSAQPLLTRFGHRALRFCCDARPPTCYNALQVWPA